jgi:ABC-2 type transport system ATP-binding protein
VFPAQEPVEITARVESPAQAATVLASLGTEGVGVAQFAVGDPSLDEVFLALTGHAAEEHVGEEEVAA